MQCLMEHAIKKDRQCSRRRASLSYVAGSIQGSEHRHRDDQGRVRAGPTPETHRGECRVGNQQHCRQRTIRQLQMSELEKLRGQLAKLATLCQHHATRTWRVCAGTCRVHAATARAASARGPLATLCQHHATPTQRVCAVRSAFVRPTTIPIAPP